MTLTRDDLLKLAKKARKELKKIDRIYADVFERCRESKAKEDAMRDQATMDI